MIFSNSRSYLGKQIGEFKLEKIAGEGRYGVCYQARATNGNRVILKKFKPGVFSKNKHKNAYEAILLSQVQDFRIPEFLGVINQKGFYGFVLEYKLGKTFETLIFKEGYRFSKVEIYQIGKKLINIIKLLHQKGIVHRDIRIQNVILDLEQVYLIDFGLARWVTEPHYSKAQDFSYLADFLLYLLYSDFECKGKRKTKAWYEELKLSENQNVFLKRLFGIEASYSVIEEVEKDFESFFYCYGYQNA